MKRKNQDVKTLMDIQEFVYDIDDYVVELRDFELIPTGNPLFDVAIGGGIPKNAITVIWGEEHTGKTTMVLQFIKSIYNYYDGKKFIIYYIDAEGRLTKSRLEQLSVNYQNIVRLVPRTVDDLKKITKTIPILLKQARDKYNEEIPAFVIIDSIDALTTRLSYEEDKDLRGGKSGDITRWLEQMKPILDNITFIIIKQYRETNIGNMFAKDNISGAYALKHLSSLTMKLSISNSKFIDDKRKAQEISVNITKSSIYPNDRKFTYIMLKTFGIDAVYSVLNYLYDNGYLKKISLGRNGKGYHIQIDELGIDIKDTTQNIYSFMINNSDSIPIWKYAMELLLTNDYYGVATNESINKTKNSVYDYYFSDFDKFKIKLTQSLSYRIDEVFQNTTEITNTVDNVDKQISDDEYKDNNILKNHIKEVE